MPSVAMSIIWPPTMPRQPLAMPSATTSSHRARASPWVSGSASTSNARVCRASPARIAVASSNLRWVEGLAAAQVVVVHARQVVVDQRVRVHHLDGGSGDPGGAGGVDPEQARHLHHQEAAHPLAATQGGVAHGLHQTHLLPFRQGQQRVDGAFHDPALLRQGAQHVHPHCCHRAHQSIAFVVSVPSARSTMACTLVSASASFASQCRRSTAPRS